MNHNIYDNNYRNSGQMKTCLTYHLSISKKYLKQHYVKNERQFFKLKDYRAQEFTRSLNVWKTISRKKLQLK